MTTPRKSIRQLRTEARFPAWGTATEFEDIRGDVAIVGIGESDYSGASGRDAKSIAAVAIANAIEDAGLEPEQIDGIMFSGQMNGQFNAMDFRSHFNTGSPLWQSGEGGGMVWAGTAAYQAAQALRRKEAKYIVNVFSVDWATNRNNMLGGPGFWHASEHLKAQLELPYGWFPQPVFFSSFARRHMHEYGTTEAQLGELVTTFRQHANSHPDAIMRDRPLSLQEYLDKPKISNPFRKEDCCLISDGGAAYIMTSPERARDLRQRPVTVEGIGRGVIKSAPYISQQASITATPQVFSAPWAYAMSRSGPEDIDVVSVYDCFSVTALMQLEDMGFCSKGEGGPFVCNGRLRYDNPRHRGGLPCNTHGGLLSHAYVLGIAHVVELVKQLRGDAANQVVNAEVAAYAGFTAEEASTLILSRA